MGWSSRLVVVNIRYFFVFGGLLMFEKMEMERRWRFADVWSVLANILCSELELELEFKN